MYHLSGNRFSGQGFFGPQGENHDQNHFVAAGMQAHIDGIAAAFKAHYPATSGIFGVHDYYLAIDDASLETGGIFDIDANWDAPHEFHRAGKDVDVRPVVLDAANSPPNNRKFLGKKEIQKAIFTYVKNAGGEYAIEPEIHLRFP